MLVKVHDAYHVTSRPFQNTVSAPPPLGFLISRIAGCREPKPADGILRTVSSVFMDSFKLITLSFVALAENMVDIVHTPIVRLMTEKVNPTKPTKPVVSVTFHAVSRSNVIQRYSLLGENPLPITVTEVLYALILVGCTVKMSSSR